MAAASASTTTCAAIAGSFGSAADDPPPPNGMIRDPCAPVSLSHVRSWIEDAGRVDVAVYAAIAATPTPSLDHAMGRLAKAADYSRLSMASAAVLAVAGGPTGRRAAVQGLASVGVTSAVVNALVKPLGRRHRPDREQSEVPFARHVPMPRSSSFP